METLKTVGLTLVGVVLVIGLATMLVPKSTSDFAYSVGSKICLKSPMDEFQVFDANVLAAFKYEEQNSYVIEVAALGGIQLADEPVLQKFETSCGK